MKKNNIKLKRYYETFYVISDTVIDIKGTLKRVYLLENEVYGDEVPCIIIDGDYNVILDNVYNGFDDLRYAIEENEL